MRYELQLFLGHQNHQIMNFFGRKIISNKLFLLFYLNFVGFYHLVNFFLVFFLL